MRGLVIGKFYPPHLGHNYLIDTAIKNSDQVTVLVVDNPDFKIPSAKRAEWLQARHPSVDVQIIPDIYDDDNSPAWALHTMKFLGYRPDIVFSSETYGKTWAEAMGCRYVDVDIARRAVPISGTLVRRDLFKTWNFLSDQTKAGLAIRIVVIGAESTGTTTLAKSLAESFKAPWVPEVGSFYTYSLATSSAGSRENDYSKVNWRQDDFHTIGKLQQQYEAAMAARSDGVIVCDTNATATEIWQRRYLGKTTAKMKAIAARDSVTLYIITGDEIPFEQNGIRDGQDKRSQMQRWFIKRIKQTGVPFVIVTGSKSERLNKAKSEARRVIRQSRIIK